MTPEEQARLRSTQRQCRRLKREVAELAAILTETNTTLAKLAEYIHAQRDAIDDLLTREDPADWWKGESQD